MPQAAEAILRGVKTTNDVRASAWDALYDATTPEDLTARLRKLPLSDQIRAELWDVGMQRFAASVPDAAPPTELLSKARGIGAGRPQVIAPGARAAVWLGLPSAGSALPVGASLATRAGAAAKMIAKNYAIPAAATAIGAGGLKAVGVPSDIAIPVATGIAIAAGLRRGRMPGYRRGAQPVATPASASGVSRGASPPAVQVPQAASGTPRTAPTPPAVLKWSPQQIRNEVGLAYRRSGLKLTEAQLNQAGELVQQGRTPAAALRQVAGAPSAPATATTAAARPPVMPKLKLNVEEGRVYQRLLRDGKTHDEAAKAIEAMRAITQKFRTPSVDDVVRRVVERNVTGRWSDR